MSFLVDHGASEEEPSQHRDPKCKNCCKSKTPDSLTCEYYIDKVMTQLAFSIEKNVAKASQEVNERLRPLTDPQHLAWVSQWTDHLKLNIVHYAIIYNRPKILHFFIAETNLFPPNHTPKVSPYAHLAAYLGSTDCLEMVLSNRPKDFFKIGKVQKHILVIPHKIARVHKQSELKGNGLIKQIETSIKIVEKLTNSIEDESDFSDVITDSQMSLIINDIDKADLKQLGTLQPSAKYKTPQNKDKERQGPLVKLLKLPPITTHAHLSQTSAQTPHSSLTHVPVHSKPSHTRSVYSTEIDDILGHTYRPSRVLGIRVNKPLKQFQLQLPNRTDSTEARKQELDNLQDKTPLTLAAERAHLDCVRLILTKVFLKHQHKNSKFKNPLTLAAKSKSPEAIILVMEKGKFSIGDYHIAMETTIRDASPKCLAALLTVDQSTRERYVESNGNLYHMLYTQSWDPEDGCRRMLPKMTSVLINNKEDVNASSLNNKYTYPLYTLIHCCFYTKPEKFLIFYLECFALLLAAKANPHFYEKQTLTDTQSRLSRKPYGSALDCIFENAVESIEYFENKPNWPRRCMKSLIIRLLINDKTRRSDFILNNILFKYMKHVCVLGLDYTVLKYLLRYGANPDAQHAESGKYAINVYFDNLFPYLTVYKKPNYEEHYLKELDHLMMLCKRMSHECLRDALRIFMDSHLTKTPLQGVHVFRYFVYLVNSMLKSPSSLSDIAALSVWKICSSNVARVRELPVDEKIKLRIVP